MRARTVLLWAFLIFLLALAAELSLVFFRISAPVDITAVETHGIKPVLSLYGFGRDPADFFVKPHDVAVDSSKNIFVSDTRNGRVVKLSLSGRLLRVFTDERYMKRPLGIDVTSDNRLLVADRFTGTLMMFDQEGNVLRVLGVKEPLKPASAGDRIYLATRGSVVILSDNGEYLYHFGRFGRGRGEFAYPNGLVVDRDNRIFVSDLNNLRVQAFTIRGEPLWIQGSPPESILQEKRVFGLPAGCTVDDKGNLYVVDAFKDAIYVLDASTGEIEAELGGERGSLEGQFNQPSGIDWIEDRLFVVADKYNDRIQLVEISVEAAAGRTEQPVDVVREFTRILLIIFTVLVILYVIRFALEKSRSA